MPVRATPQCAESSATGAARVGDFRGLEATAGPDHGLLLWTYIGEGMTPIDALQKATVEIARAIDTLVEEGSIDSAKINLKTLH